MDEPSRPEGAFRELAALLRRGGRWWMTPLIVALCLLACGLVLLHAIEYVAPFVYVAQ